jgi:hypothetical protein
MPASRRSLWKRWSSRRSEGGSTIEALAELPPGSAGGCLPAPPHTRTRGFPAYGSLSYGFAAYTECTTRALGQAALWLTSRVRSPRPRSPRPARPGVINRFHPIPVFGPQGTCGSPKFPENPIVPRPCSRTPAEPRCLAFTAPRCCPPATETGGPRRPGAFRSSITRPEHWLFTLRAAITDDDAKLASGGWPSFPGWDSSVPTEFYREVSAFRPPLPLGFAWR